MIRRHEAPSGIAKRPQFIKKSFCEPLHLSKIALVKVGMQCASGLDEFADYRSATRSRVITTCGVDHSMMQVIRYAEHFTVLDHRRHLLAILAQAGRSKACDCTLTV